MSNPVIHPDYTVIIKRENELLDHDTFSCESTGAARRDFYECHRHSNYEIIDTVTEPVGDIQRIAADKLNISDIYTSDDECFDYPGAPDIRAYQIRAALREAYISGRESNLQELIGLRASVAASDKDNCLKLTDEERLTLRIFLLMSTAYRKGEEQACRELGEEVGADGKPVFPNMAPNAEWWGKTNALIDDLLKTLGD